MKTILPWILAVGFCAGAAALYVSGNAKDKELATLREEHQQAEAIRADLDAARSQAAAQSNELVQLSQDKQELLGLRNEVNQLRSANRQLSGQMQSAKSDVELARTQTAQAIKNSQLTAQNAAALQAELEQRRKAALTGQSNAINACLNNLRQIDAAKQQWALEKGKTVEAIPAPQDLAPYLPGNTLPVCPSGGAYTLNAVGQLPTCSIPGHELPK